MEPERLGMLLTFAALALSVVVVGAEAAPAPAFNVTLLITRATWGAVFMVDKDRGQQCDATTPHDSCACVGGAARRRTILEQGRHDPNTLLIDAGGYFSGSGMFFPTFRGNASRDMFADAGYNMWSLSFRDFGAGVSTGDPTGADLLVSYITSARARSNSPIPLPTVTNLELDAADPLAGYVGHHAMVELGGGRRAAFISVTDPTHVWPLNPEYAAKMGAFAPAVTRELAALQRLPDGERPDIVVALLTMHEMGVSEGDVINAGGRSAARERWVESLVHSAIGIDVVLLRNMPVAGPHDGGYYYLRNWAGDHVLVIPDPYAAFKGAGVDLDRVTVAFDGRGFLAVEAGDTVLGNVDSGGTWIEGGAHRGGRVPLTCAVAAHAATSAAVDAYLARMVQFSEAVAGHLSAPASGVRVAPGNGTESVSVPANRVDGRRFAGCRVSECPAGNLIADAYRHVTGADVAISNGGQIRNSLAGGAVTVGNLVQMLPFLNDIYIVTNVSAAALRAALANSITYLRSEDAATDPDGRFLQVSGLRFEWYFDFDREAAETVPKVAKVDLWSEASGTWAPLEDDAVLTMGMTNYLADGGDEFSMFQHLPRRPTGFKAFKAVERFLGAHGGSAAAPLSVEISEPPRIRQQPEVVTLELGLLCKAPPAGAAGDAWAAAHPQAANLSWTSLEREECDRALHVVELLNDKGDGFFDALLPNAHIAAEWAVVGCGERPSLAFGAFRSLAARLPALTAVIGPSCSNDARDLASAAWRASPDGGRAVLISASSTAPALADDARYPNLARMVPNDTLTSVATEALVTNEFRWRHVAVLHGPSVWERGMAEGFIALFKAGGGTVLNDGDTAVAEAGTDRFDPDKLLQRLEDCDARVIFVALYERDQRALFARSYDAKRVHGTDTYVYLSALPSEDIFYNPDDSLNASAAEGARGLLGFMAAAEVDPVGNANQRKYFDLWRARAGKAACAGGPEAAPDRPYCSASDAARGFQPGTYAAFWAEAVLAYGVAMDAHFRVGDVRDGDALYKVLTDPAKVSFQGVSGGAVQFERATGDRSGGLVLYHTVFERVTANPEDLRSLTYLKPVLKPVGYFDPATRQFRKNADFPAERLDVLDAPPAAAGTGVPEAGIPGIIVAVGIIGATVIVGLSCVLWRNRRERLRKLDPSRAINSWRHLKKGGGTPKPIPADRFSKKWNRGPQQRDKLEKELLALLEGWGFRDTGEAKFDYLTRNVFSLKEVWSDDARFSKMKKLAAKEKLKVEEKFTQIVIEMASDESAGAYICNDLEPMKGNMRRPRASLDVDGGGCENASECWLPKTWMQAAEATPEEDRNKFEHDVLVHSLKHLATCSFAGFRDALARALPEDAWLEPGDDEDEGGGGGGKEDGATSDTPPPPMPLRIRQISSKVAKQRMKIRCIRKKSIKNVKRMAAKVRSYQESHEGHWPYVANIGDALRASVTAQDAAGLRAAWECIAGSFEVFKLKNKFAVARSRLARDEDGNLFHPDNTPRVFPNLHLNVLFRAEGCAPMIAEIQLHLHDVLALAKQDHKLYEVKRAAGIGDLLSKEGGDSELVRKVNFSNPVGDRRHLSWGGFNTMRHAFTKIRHPSRAEQLPIVVESAPAAPLPVDTADVTVNVSMKKK
jgi:ABC-type branched-subunit amino acid transport system substrate-binding protein